MLSSAPVQLLQGDHVVELRPHGVAKGHVARSVLQAAPANALALGAGDDRTDEDLFAALPPDAIAIHVGPGESRAALRVVDVGALRAFPEQLAARAEAADAAAAGADVRPAAS